MSYEIIQAARQKGRCTSFEFCYASTGTPQIACQFTIADGEPDQGRYHTEFFALSDAALEYTVAKLRTMGWGGDDLYALTQEDISQDVVLKFKHETWNGEPRARIEFIDPVNRAVKTERAMSDEDKKKFGRAMQAKIRALGGKKPSSDKHRETDTRQGAHPDAPGNDGGAPPRSDDDWG